ncbi:MAG: preprotein translocase subunit YajC [Pseudonocardiales bacterium]|nr:MAG: preprotein translocase subunit YajC [Pseudonocardiales bacterium]
MYWPYLLVLAGLLALFIVGQRKRRLQMAQETQRISEIGFGDEVMTTSGLYGTVVGRSDDGTVQLAIAPGVEVKWAIAALRDAKSLPDQYRKGLAEAHDDDAEPPNEGDSGP